MTRWFPVTNPTVLWCMLLAWLTLFACNRKTETKVPPAAPSAGNVAATTDLAKAQYENPPKSVVQLPTGAANSDAESEALFVGWPEPKLVFFITGQQHGYIEPCGCTGLVNQKGGLSRRHTLAKQLAQRGWTLVPVDVGNQVRKFGRQSEIKFQVAIEGLKRIGYRAIAFGADDLRLSAMEVLAVSAPTDQQQTPFVSANATILDPSLTPTFQVLEAGGKRIGITSVLGSGLREGITNSEIGLKTAEEGLKFVAPKLLDQKCDVYLLLAHASLDESRQLAAQFPFFQIVVTSGGMGDPAFQPEQIPNTNALLVQVGVKGMYVGVLGVFDDPQRPFRYQRVPLDSRFEDSRDMLQLLASYQDQLKALGLDGLGLKPIPHSSGKKFAGSESCKECHGHEYEVWEKSAHAHALESLIQPGERSEIPRHYDPECISCHVIGWDPQRHFPYVSGYLGLEQTPLMQHVGCESCHGPGAEHVAAETGDVKAHGDLTDKLRAGVRLPLDQAEKKCIECHDLDNSQNFHVEGAFEKFWADVEH